MRDRDAVRLTYAYRDKDNDDYNDNDYNDNDNEIDNGNFGLEKSDDRIFKLSCEGSSQGHHLTINYRKQ